MPARKLSVPVRKVAATLPDPPPPLPPRFDRASERILAYLRRAVPMGTWTVTRVVDDRQLYLTVDDVAFDIPAGASIPWPDSFCQYMVAEAVPRICPDIDAYPDYGPIVTGGGMRVRSYIGLPIVTSDGTFFGTLCGFSPAPQDESVHAQEPLLDLLVDLLTNVLEADIDRTAAERDREHAERLAAVDPLTGLLNRGAWDRLIEHEEARYRRFGDTCALVCVDLDELKAINDSAGHAAGDDLLRRAAQILSANVRAGDVLARVGGDEFGVLAPGTVLDEAANLSERLREALLAEGISASFGCAPYSIDDGFLGTWKNADQAMYADKRSRAIRRR